MLLFADSLRYKWLSANVEGFFDQRGRYAENIDWTDPDLTPVFSDKKSADLHRAVFSIEPNSYIKVGIGKDSYNWGPMKLGGLMLSDWNMGITGLFQNYHFGPFEVKAVASQLNSTPWGNRVDFSNETIEHRYFSAARVEFYRQRFGIALAQSSIYAGEGRSFEIPYLIPIFPFHYAQMSSWRYGNNGDNSYGGLDGYVNFVDSKIKLYGELFVDDFQGEGDAISQSVQNNVAGMAGASWDFTKAYGFIEGGQINSRVYNHVSGEKLRYQNKHAFLGSPLGPDQKLLWGTAGYRIRPELTIDLTGWLRQSGEKEITSTYTNVRGTREDAIPYGVIEQELSGWGTVRYHWKGISAELNGGLTHTTNIDHIKNEESTEPFFSIKIKTGINLNWENKETLNE